MAATRGILTPNDKGGPKPSVTRVGHASMAAEANTWRTFARAFVSADGSGYVEVGRDGAIIHKFRFEAESRGGQS